MDQQEFDFSNRKLERYSHALAVYQHTSREAWQSFQPFVSVVDAAILDAIVQGSGLTSEAVEEVTGLKHQTVSAQIRHMAEAGLLVDSGRRAATDSGRLAIVWVLG